MLAQEIDESLIEEAEKENHIQHFFTTMEHLKAHHGFRKGVISGYIGTSGCGKSSLMKTLALQAASGPNANVLYWLSEESAIKYAKAMKRYSDLAGRVLSQIKFFEESSIDHESVKTHKDFLETFREVVVSGSHQIVFIDNVTTSSLYKGSLTEQGMTVEFLKNLAKDLNISIVFVAHTSSKVSDNQGFLITMEQIRGSNDLVIQSSYLYILQKYTSNGTIFLTLRTVKSRDHDKAFGNYVLKYDHELGLYTGDLKVEFEQLNEIFKKRDRLGGGK